MKSLMSAFIVFFIAGCTLSSGDAENRTPPTPKMDDMWVSSNNFKQFPNYIVEEELDQKPADGECLEKECTSLRVGSSIYLYGVLVTEHNFKDIVLGTWTGGDCRYDSWEMGDKGNFQSKFPKDGEAYSWSGTYKFTGGIYSEDGLNDSGDKELNTANLFYFPSNRVLLYRGLSGVDSIDEEGQIQYMYYHGPQFYYFKNCNG